MGTKKTDVMVAVLIVISMVVFFLRYDQIVFDFADEYISLIPSMILIIFAVYGIKDSSGSIAVGSFIMLGLGFAFLTAELNTLGILIPDILSASLPLKYLQLLIVVFSAIIGAILSRN